MRISPIICAKLAYPQSAVLKCRTFAVANKLQRRVKAAAQQSSNKFGSAFALHFTCTVNEASGSQRNDSFGGGRSSPRVTRMISTGDGDNLHQGKGIISMRRKDYPDSSRMIFLRGKDGIPFTTRQTSADRMFNF